MRYFTSDTHFGHARIIELCNRPFRDIEHMDEVLINNWNDTVSPKDTVYHLGDVALGSWERWDGILTRLNGTKILVTGNHDRIFRSNKEGHIDRFRPLYESWFSGGVEDDYSVTLGGHFAVMSHFPYEGDSHDEDRYSGDRLQDAGIPLIHGHTHGTEHDTFSKKGTPMFHVGVDAHDFRPVSETEITAWLNSVGVSPTTMTSAR